MTLTLEMALAQTASTLNCLGGGMMQAITSSLHRQQPIRSLSYPWGL
jgi:hypothetical protein